jgi:hypothetical protein
MAEVGRFLLLRRPYHTWVREPSPIDSGGAADASRFIRGKPAVAKAFGRAGPHEPHKIAFSESGCDRCVGYHRLFVTHITGGIA